MKILHYFLGFPPYRTGGMTKFACDLMLTQKENGNEVIALWPGKMTILNDDTKIKESALYNEIKNYEIINPLPVPLDEGIKDIPRFIKKIDEKVYWEFLHRENPDIIHIHTLMGIHKEFFDVANKLNIKMIYTTHDYFGICPKVTLFKNNNVCDSDHDCRDCVYCNENALSFNKIRLIQSPIYRKMKDTKIIRKIRKRHRTEFFDYSNYEKDRNSKSIENNHNTYKELRKFYINILEKINIIHFNSKLTESIFLKYLKPMNYKTITISHSDIQDNRTLTEWKYDKIISITFLASLKPLKGFEILKKALDELWEEGIRNFKLNLYSDFDNPSQYMNIISNGYKYEELPNIMKKTDILVAPSVGYETFGYTVLEAISYGIPVIISDNVGAKDIICDNGIVIKANSVSSLKEALKSLDEKKMKQLKKEAIENSKIKLWNQFVEEIYNLYKGKDVKND